MCIILRTRAHNTQNTNTNTHLFTNTYTNTNILTFTHTRKNTNTQYAGAGTAKVAEVSEPM